jgi:predicted  nucleic acid-binding Zn-ribbon protein
LPIDVETLKAERDRLRDVLRETETDVRKVEADLKVLRQREIQTKREIEALSTLIEMREQRDTKGSEG